MLDTAKKLAEYDTMQQRLAHNMHLEGEVQYLIDQGLMKMDAEGTVSHVGSYEEHQRLQQQHLQE